MEIVSLQSGYCPPASDVTIQLPYSKSESNRVLVIDALAARTDGRLSADWCQQLAEGNGVIANGFKGICDDTQVMLDWLSTLPQVVNIGAAGTAMRFSTALLCVLDQETVITGSERMKHRPIGILVEALRRLGAHIDYLEEEGFPPLRINGNADMEGGEVDLPGNVSSQYISALLMIAPTLKGGLLLHLTGDVVSKPYIDMTLQKMRLYGAKAGWTDERTITVAPSAYHRPTVAQVERDWSAASYWYELLALSEDQRMAIRLPGLYPNSVQGDARISILFEQLGVKTNWTEDGICLTKTSQVSSRFDYDFVNEPDMAQTFVVTCCMLGIPFHFVGLQSLKIKETDRIHALRVELRKLGFDVQEANDSELIWNGERTEQTQQGAPVAIDTYDDHRMAMAFAPSVLTLGQLQVRHPEVISKSYPTFWDDFQQFVNVKRTEV